MASIHHEDFSGSGQPWLPEDEDDDDDEEEMSTSGRWAPEMIISSGRKDKKK